MNAPFQNITWIESHFQEILPSDEVVLDLKYATSDNFMRQDVYQSFHRCFLSPLAAQHFQQACLRLSDQHPSLQFRIWDALRPRSVQAQFYSHLHGTPFQGYVAAPYPGSLHNYGMALDLTLQNKSGELLDMGTDFDDFRDLAQPQLEETLLASGSLTKTQYSNRLLLREIMENEGFKVLAHEWWHFNALPKEEVWHKFPVVE
ncbi:MAG: M15 family metallopeptidase [Bdellovibrio sp.]